MLRRKFSPTHPRSFVGGRYSGQPSNIDRVGNPASTGHGTDVVFMLVGHVEITW